MANSHASDVIEEALNKVLSEIEDSDPDDILVEWVLVAYVANPDEEKGSGYPLLYSNGNIPSHRAQGLLLKGLMNVE